MSIWGVDSASNVTEELYNCVLQNFGKPDYWGRYLTRVEGSSEELTQAEIDLLHNSDTRIMPIYNEFLEALGTRQGRVTAYNAIFHARRLGIPEETPLFANIENFFSVDADWVVGYVDMMFTSGYRPGFYHDPDEGDFSVAYCQAVEQSQQVANQSILWSAEPEPGVTARRNAPEFNPSEPPCQANVWGWQYGRDADECPIDTNLIDERLYNMLW
ncbi:glycoside hydrolase domain-containing protein [Alkalibacillus aidingensis]|uniref:glycoside hydrolase domain-containing protein n=1 Tax=Alkalibacillus aidingensis TaxID=2747607 RepID=UPI0016615D98|nr:glycoside hydrolase domain-containing protein [Alkalibacillus aidingensis]